MNDAHSENGHDDACMCTEIAEDVAYARQFRGRRSLADRPADAITPARTESPETGPETAPSLTVYVARKIITMDPGIPAAQAVAVSGERIVAVGTLETLEPWLRSRPHAVDYTFADKVLLPGLIDPHLHPWLMAMLLSNTTIIAPESWTLPDRVVPPVANREQLLARLRQAYADHTDPDQPMFAWGWNHYFHGALTREDLTLIAPDTPLAVWHRSFHEVVLNDAALVYFEISEDGFSDDILEHVSFERGHFWETAKRPVMAAMSPYLFEPERIRQGFEVAKKLIWQGGVTTIADMLAGSGWDPEVEWNLMQEVFDNDDSPIRLMLCPCPRLMEDAESTPETILERLARLPETNTHRLIWMNAIKSFADGAFISQLMRLSYPGYIDGHKGAWLVPPGELEASIVPFWQNNYDVYHHVNGDEGLDVTLDVLEKLRDRHPRADASFEMHHFGISREDQVARLARLGATVSTNGYYLYLFGDKFAEVGVGYERASQMTRHGSLARHGVRFTMHSDCPMGPVSPLLAVQTAVTRTTSSGAVLGIEQAVTLDQALAAVTCDAAASLRLDGEIGSVVSGKKADFTVLEADPYDVEPTQIADIPIWGTVFEGQLHKI